MFQNKTTSTFGDNGSLMQHWKWLQVVDHKTKNKTKQKQTYKQTSFKATQDGRLRTLLIYKHPVTFQIFLYSKP